MNNGRLEKYIGAIMAVNLGAEKDAETQMHRTMHYLKTILDNTMESIIQGQGAEACVYLDTMMEACREIFQGLSEDVDKDEFINSFNELQFARMQNGMSGRVVPPEV